MGITQQLVVCELNLKFYTYKKKNYAEPYGCMKLLLNLIILIYTLNNNLLFSYNHLKCKKKWISKFFSVDNNKIKQCDDEQ